MSVLLLTLVCAAQFLPPPTVPPLPMRAVDLSGVTSRRHRQQQLDLLWQQMLSGPWLGGSSYL